MSLAALLLSLCLPAAEQPPPRQAPQAWPIESLTVTGNRNYSREQILAAAGLKVGQKVTPKDLEAARDRLAATEAFQTIEFRFGPAPSGKAYAVSFQVAEAEPLFPVRLEDLGLPEEEIKTHLRRSDPLFGERIPATDALLKRYARAIEELLESKGRPQTVLGRVAAEPGEPPAVVFGPAAAPPAIAEVRFSGNQVIPATALQRAISGLAIGAPYREKRFRQWLETSVRPLYEARGRLRVAFPEIRAEPARDIKGVIVTVRIQEGDSYKLGAVRIEGGPLEAAELLRAADLKTGDLYDGAAVQAGLERIEKRLRREGYLRARAESERQIHEEDRRADLLIRVQAGPQFLFGRLVIEGLDLNAEAAIRRMWTLKPGRPFNADYPEYFLSRVREEGVLENLKKAAARVTPHEETGTADVTLEFR